MSEETEVKTEPVIEQAVTEVAEVEVNQFGRPINLNYNGKGNYDTSNLLEEPQASGAPATKETKTEEVETNTPQPEEAKQAEPQAPTESTDQEVDLGDGKKEKLSLLIENHKKIRQRFGEVGNKEDKVNRKEQELVQREQKLQTELRTVNEYVKSLDEAVRTGNADKIVDAIAEMAQVDPVDMWEALEGSLLKAVEERSQLSESERQLLKREKRTERAQKKLERERTKLESSSRTTQEEQEILQMIQQNNTTQEELKQAASEMDKLAAQGHLKPEYMQQMQKADRKTKINELIKFNHGKKVGNYLDNLVGSVNPSLKGDKILFDELIALFYAPRSKQLTEGDLVDIIKGYNSEEAKPSDGKKDASSTKKPEVKQAVKKEEKKQPDFDVNVKPVKASELLNEIF